MVRLCNVRVFARDFVFYAGVKGAYLYSSKFLRLISLFSSLFLRDDRDLYERLEGDHR